MPSFPGWCGPSGRMASVTAGAEWSGNWFLEKNDAGTPAESWAMYSRPALRRVAWCGAGPILGLFEQDGRCFVVSGATFGELLPSMAFTTIGSVNTGGVQATISSSGAQGDQLFITAGGNGYIYTLSTGAFAQIFDAAFPDYVLQGIFLQAAFLTLSGDGALAVSANEDGSSWNALDRGYVSNFSDRIIGMTRTHDRVFLFGTQNTQPMVNQGTGGIAGYVPDGGTIIETGTAAAFACTELDNAPIWLARNREGTAMVMRADGYTPKRVSTHAVEYDLRRAAPSDLEFAVSTSVQMQGHAWYLLYVPGRPTTWVLDLSHGAWVEWYHGDPRYGTTVPFRGVNHAYAFGRHLMGDRASGAIYELTLDAEQDRL